MSAAEVELELEPVEVDVTVAIGGLLAAAALYAAKGSFDGLIGYPLRGLADLVGKVPLVGGSVKGGIDDVIADVDRHLGDAALAAEGVGVRFLLGLWHLIEADAAADVAFAENSWHAFERLVDTTIPGAISSDVDWWKRELEKGLGAASGGIDQALHGIDHLDRRLTDELHGIDETLREHLGALERTLEGDIESRVGEAEHVLRGELGGEIEALRRLLEHDYRLLLEATGVGAIAAVIAEELPWSKCSNVGHVGRKLCNLPVKLLEDLLAGAVAILAATELCRVGQLAQYGAEKALPILDKWLLLEPVLCLGGGATLPSAYSEPAALTTATPSSVI